MEVQDELEALTGVVDNIIFASPEGSFCVFRLLPEGQKSTVTVTVQMAAPLQGQQLDLKGRWVEHPRFGTQFNAVHMIVSAPTGVEGIRRFLASGTIEGVGKAMAARIVDKFGGMALEIIEKQPHRLREVRGIGKKTAEKIHASYQEKAELRQVMVWLEQHNVSGIFAGKIYERYGSFSVEVMEQNPYRLATEIEGIGFSTADAIAASLGLDPCDAFRVSAALSYQLQRIAVNGHCCVPENQLVDDVEKGIMVPRDVVWEVLKQDLATGRLDQGAPSWYIRSISIGRKLRRRRAFCICRRRRRLLPPAIPGGWCIAGKRKQELCWRSSSGRRWKRCWNMVFSC